MKVTLALFATLLRSSNGFSMSAPAVATNLKTELKSAWTTPIKEGDVVPSVTFKTRVRIESDDQNPFDWKDVTSEDYFKGKRTVIFSLPGAFTPTCSSTHLPGYEAAYEEIKSLGVDEVYCLSVNDAFVMRQWGLHQGLTEDKTIGANGFEKVKLIPDGAALFTRGMGMSCNWDTERGFGERSWRYSAVINDMKVEKLFIEGGGITQNSGPDPFEVSDAKTMVEYLKSKA
jgi:peroxiredoxin